MFAFLLAASVAVSLAIAELSYRYVEQPFIRLGHALASGFPPIGDWRALTAAAAEALVSPRRQTNAS